MMPFKPDERNMGGIAGVSSHEGLAPHIAHGSQPTGAATALEASIQQGQVINYYFPVEVEVLGTLDESEVQRIAQYVYDELITALKSQAPRVI